MTKLTLEIDGTICSMEIPYNDVSAAELIKGFGSLMIGQGCFRRGSRRL